MLSSSPMMCLHQIMTGSRRRRPQRLSRLVWCDPVFGGPATSRCCGPHDECTERGSSLIDGKQSKTAGPTQLTSARKSDGDSCSHEPAQSLLIHSVAARRDARHALLPAGQHARLCCAPRAPRASAARVQGRKHGPALRLARRPVPQVRCPGSGPPGCRRAAGGAAAARGSGGRTAVLRRPGGAVRAGQVRGPLVRGGLGEARLCRGRAGRLPLHPGAQLPRACAVGRATPTSSSPRFGNPAAALLAGHLRGQARSPAEYRPRS